jgi:octaprenyl-diphosphate synthase
MLDHLLIPIQIYLDKVEEILANNHKSAVPLISTAAQYVTQNGGKRIRPAIFILSAKLAGAVDERIPHLASAIELIHTASLLHDDVVDDATLRRGKPSAKVKWGNQVSVLLGDFLWCKASELFVEHGTERLWHIITKTTTEITEGQILEITRLNDMSTNEEIYKKIVEGKTASLFSFCGQGAAIIQNLSLKFESALANFGFNLGVAFQLTDDVLDYTSKESRLGKSAGSDLREGKLTLPVIIALKKCSQDEKNLIKDCLMSGRMSGNQFNQVVEIVHKYDGINETTRLARAYAKKANESLALFKPSIERDALIGISEYVVDRNE